MSPSSPLYQVGLGEARAVEVLPQRDRGGLGNRGRPARNGPRIATVRPPGGSLRGSQKMNSGGRGAGGESVSSLVRGSSARAPVSNPVAAVGRSGSGQPFF